MADENQQQQGKNKGGGGGGAKSGVTLQSNYDASEPEFNLSNTILGAGANAVGYIAAAFISFWAAKGLRQLPWFKSTNKSQQTGGGFSFDAVNEKSGKALAAHLARTNPTLAIDMAEIIQNISAKQQQQQSATDETIE